jgi:hypothetical protein
VHGGHPSRRHDQSGGVAFQVHAAPILSALLCVSSLDRINRRLVAENGFRLGAITLDDCNSERIGLDKSLEFVIPTRKNASSWQQLHNNTSGLSSDVVGGAFASRSH